MKHIQSLDSLFESEFKKMPITRDRFDNIQISSQADKIAAFVDRLLSIVFYEADDKRHEPWTLEKVSAFKPVTKDYLLDLYNILQDEGLLYTLAFRDDYGKLPETPEEKIVAISGNHWGGFGRRAKADSMISQLPVPPPEVIDDLLSTLSPQYKRSLEDLYRKYFGG